MKKTLFILVGFILLFSMLLGACGKATPATSTAPTTVPTTTAVTTKPPTSAPPTTSVPTTPPAPTGDQYGGIYKASLAVGPSRPIGYLPDAANDSFTAARPALQKLAKQRMDGGVEGELATGWKVADDLSSVTLTLRKGVKFHDGSDWNADVCKWNLEISMAAKVSSMLTFKSLDKVDDYTIRINLTSYSNQLINNFCSGQMEMISKAYVDKNGIDAARWNPVGTGPFIFVSYERDAKITYKRNPNYWEAGKPYLDGVTMTVISDSTVRKMAFQKGDLSALMPTGLDAVELQKAGFPVRTNPGGTYLLVPDSLNRNSPWSNILVRQAASCALDRVSLAKGLGYGFAVPSYQLYGLYVDARVPGLQPTEFNLAKSKDLLRQAGYPSGFSTVSHSYPRIVPKDYTEAVAAQLRLAGINVTTDYPEAGKYEDLRYKGWNDGVLSHGITASANKNYSMSLYFTGKDFVSLKLPTGFQEGYAASMASVQYNPKLVQACFQLLCDDVTLIPYIEAQNTTFEQKGMHNPGMDTYDNMYQEYQDIWLEKSAR